MLKWNIIVLLRSCSFLLGRGSVVLPIFPDGHSNVCADHYFSQILAGGCFVVVCGIQLYLYVASILEHFHNDAGSLDCARSHRRSFIIVLFSLSSVPFICGWCGIVVVFEVPISDRNIPILVYMTSFALSA